MDETITSFANPVVKRVRQLADRKHRRREDAFAVEGLQPVWRAVTSGWRIQLLLVAPELLVNPDALRMVEEQERSGIRIVRVSAEVFVRLSDRDGPAGLAAVVEGRVPDLGSFVPRGTGPIVALYRAGNPGNVGTILRTADAAGAGGVVLVGSTADPLAPASVKASMGSVFAVPTAHAGECGDLFGWAAAGSRPVVAVTGSARRPLWQGGYHPGTVLLLGSEGDGLPADVVDRCDDAVTIPMEGTTESLNLAAAAAVMLYELKRHRSAHSADRVAR